MRGLDDTDREILRLLADDARRPYSDIADEVGLSPPAVSDRIDRLCDLGVIRGFTIDIDRSVLGGGTPVLCELRVSPGDIERVRESIETAEAVEHVFTTADARIVFTATLSERDVRGILTETTAIESIRDYDARLLSATAWTPRVGDATFAPECVECGNTVDEEGITTRLDGTLYHFCCPSCESQFSERYESFREDATG